MSAVVQLRHRIQMTLSAAPPDERNLMEVQVRGEDGEAPEGSLVRGEAWKCKTGDVTWSNGDTSTAVVEEPSAKSCQRDWGTCRVTGGSLC